MKNRIAELNDSISNLRMRIAKEESDKLEAIELHRTDKEARSAAEKMQACLSTELEKVREEKSAAERKAISNDDMYMRLQQYISSLLSDLQLANKSLQQYNDKYQNLETEKTTIVETLSKVRGQYRFLQEQLASLKASQDEATKQKEEQLASLKAFQDEATKQKEEQLASLKAFQDEATKQKEEQLASLKASQDEATKQKEMLANDLKSLREDLKQVRDDRDYQFGQVQALTKEVAEYKV